jgi:spore germination protein GerM
MTKPKCIGMKWENRYLFVFMAFWLLLMPQTLYPFYSVSDDDAGTVNRNLLSEKAPDRLQAYLYYADSRSQFLKAETRLFSPAEDPVSVCRLLVEAIIDGPSGDLAATIPEGTRVLAVYITGDKTAWIDLSREVSAGPGGIWAEVMALYSIVNTVTLNMPEVEQVKLLIEGEAAETLAGHLDIRIPYKANMLLVR